MTAILRILEHGDLKWEVALRGVQRIGGITFYELDVADIPDVPGTKEFPPRNPSVEQLRQPGVDRPPDPPDLDQRGYPIPEDTP